MDQAKRALVALLRTLAAAYACAVRVTRESEDAEVRTAYKARLRAVLRSKKTQGVAGRIAAGLLKVCKEVVKKKGAASRG